MLSASRPSPAEPSCAPAPGAVEGQEPSLPRDRATLGWAQGPPLWGGPVYRQTRSYGVLPRAPALPAAGPAPAPAPAPRSLRLLQREQGMAQPRQPLLGQHELIPGLGGTGSCPSSPPAQLKEECGGKPRTCQALSHRRFARSSIKMSLSLSCW